MGESNNRVARGVRKVNETIAQDGRALILTEAQADKLLWSDIPVGSIRINTSSSNKGGTLSVKLEGESDWVPAGIKNDGTISIAKDTIVKEETFTIVSLDDGNGTFTYKNSKGEQRHQPITSNGGHVFELEEGDYLPMRNQLEVWIDDVLRRNVKTGGIEELDAKRFVMTEPLSIGMEITAKYAKVFRVGNPYPRFFINNNAPSDSEIGDFWLDLDATLADELGENIEGMDYKIPFANITGKPTTLAGYGITDKVSYEGHIHNLSQIAGFPSSLPANGGNSDTVDGCHAGNNAGNVLKIGANGKIPEQNVPTHKHNVSDINGLNTASVPVAQKLARDGNANNPMQFNWKGQNGQPSWVWGGNDGTNMFVYNPNNFSVAHAKNADSINGKTLDNMVNYGHSTPTMTPLIDWDTMEEKYGVSSRKTTVNTVIDGQSVTKVIPGCKNTRNATTGIFAYGGDYITGDMHEGDILLKQDYHNFDEIMCVFTNDNGNYISTTIHKVFVLDYLFKNSWRFELCNSDEAIWWTIYGSVRQGTDENQRCSTNTRWNTYNQNASIVEIYGIKY